MIIGTTTTYLQSVYHNSYNSLKFFSLQVIVYITPDYTSCSILNDKYIHTLLVPKRIFRINVQIRKHLHKQKLCKSTKIKIDK